MTRPPRRPDAGATPRGSSAVPGPRVRVLVAGGTGLVGQALLARLAADARCRSVTALIRRPEQRQALPRGVQGLQADYALLGCAGEPGLPAADWAFCCLGTTIKAAGSQSAFRAVDFDAVLAFARAAKVAGVQRLAVVSALGADAGSTVFYNRVKGETEDALRALALPRLVLARPSLLLGDRAALGQATRPGEALAQRLTPWLGALLPARLRPIRADAVAAALLAALAAPEPPDRAAHPLVKVLDNAALMALAAG